MFGSPLSKKDNSFLRSIGIPPVNNFRDILANLLDNSTDTKDSRRQAASKILKNSVNNNLTNYVAAENDHFAIRTCNSFWNPQVTIAQTNVDPFFLGMSSQATEREDTIITPDLRGKVFGPLEYTRRDLMAINMQRARDHGLPDYNSARVAYSLPPKKSFEEINELYGVDDTITENIENLRDVYNNDISRCDIWACGLAETVPSDLSNMSGPGELFTEVLFDQFMRIRHADRFWWENYAANGIFTEKEYNTIKELTLKKLLIAVTHIRDADISDKPFVFDKSSTICPQPFQLSELFMDDCTNFETFDYYNPVGLRNSYCMGVHLPPYCSRYHGHVYVSCIQSIQKDKDSCFRQDNQG